jgi:hypothetical protein
MQLFALKLYPVNAEALSQWADSRPGYQCTGIIVDVQHRLYKSTPTTYIVKEINLENSLYNLGIDDLSQSPVHLSKAHSATA